MNSLLIFVILFCGSITAKGALGGQTNSEQPIKKLAVKSGLKNIKKTNWEIGGNLGIGYSSISGAIINASPRFQYFFFDRFSAGLTLDYHRTNSLEKTGIGPSMAYYFWEQERWASYLGQNIVTTHQAKKGLEILGATSLGLNYFVTPAVALGFSLNHSYTLNNNTDNFTFSSLRGAALVYF